jgi:diguanylate cyclase (GGDEF)-like protein
MKRMIDLMHPPEAFSFLTAYDTRKNHTLRKRLDEMSREELIREILTDELTHLPNRRSYNEVEKKAIQVVIDVDSLKWVNDTLGHAAGDGLLKEIAAALHCSEVEAYRVGGDEFFAQFDDRIQAVKFMVHLQRAIGHCTFTDGRRKWKGVGFSFGIGGTLSIADDVCMKQKLAREEGGVRAPRGVQPPALVELSA